MKKFLCLLLAVCLLTGCGTVPKRLTRLRDKNENVVTIEVSRPVDEAKEIVREAGKELNLREIKKFEKDDFIVLYYKNTWKLALDGALVGGFGLLGLMAGSASKTPTASTLGIFFDVDAERKVSKIMISEEVSSLYVSLRETLVHRIKEKLEN